MNQTTEEVLEFLNFPDLDFGTTPLDLEMMQDPALMRDLTIRLLTGPLPSDESRKAAQALSGRLDAVDWDIVAKEMQARVSLASGFFDPDTETDKV
ncbi:MAG: hypothetical protein ACRYFS_20145 [Janthinobacterium lividum]